MFGGSSASAASPLFGSSSSSSSTPAFGIAFSSPLFGSSSAPASSIFGASTPAFGATSTPAFGASTPSPFASTSTPLFGAASTPSLFGANTSPGLFGSSSTPSFAQSGGLFGSASQPAFGSSSPFGQSPSLFRPPQSGPPFGQSQPTLFGQTSSPFAQSTPIFGQLQPTPFGTPQLTTQMAPVAPLSVPLPDREVQAIVDAYKDDPSNPRYAFRHLLLSVTDPSFRIKPLGVSDIMWAEAMNKLEGMESSERERLWPELVQGFKDLSRRLKLQDEALVSDAQRLQATESNVKQLKRHFEADTLPWMQRLRQKEQELQRRLLKLMRIIEALESKGFRIPLMKGEAQIGERLQTLSRQLQGPRAELPRRVNALLSTSRMQTSVGGVSSTALLGAGKINEESLADMHKVLQKQTEATKRLVNVLKRDMRDLEIMMTEDLNMPNEQL